MMVVSFTVKFCWLLVGTVSSTVKLYSVQFFSAFHEIINCLPSFVHYFRQLLVRKVCGSYFTAHLENDLFAADFINCHKKQLLVP